MQKLYDLFLQKSLKILDREHFTEIGLLFSGLSGPSFLNRGVKYAVLRLLGNFFTDETVNDVRQVSCNYITTIF